MILDVLQIATNDISISFGKTMLSFDYPWGDDLTGELLAYAFYVVARKLTDAYENIEVTRAAFNDD